MAIEDYTDDFFNEVEEIEYIEIKVSIIKETAKAIMFLNDELEKIWLPKSQIEILFNEQDMAHINVPEWLIDSNNLEEDSCIL